MCYYSVIVYCWKCELEYLICVWGVLDFVLLPLYCDANLEGVLHVICLGTEKPRGRDQTLTTSTLATFSYVHTYMRERERVHFCVIEMDGYWMLKPENHIIDGGEIQAVHCNFMKSPFPLEMRREDTLTLYSALTSHYRKITHVSTRHFHTPIFADDDKKQWPFRLVCWLTRNKQRDS